MIRHPYTAHIWTPPHWLQLTIVCGLMFAAGICCLASFQADARMNGGVGFFSRAFQYFRRSLFKRRLAR